MGQETYPLVTMKTGLVGFAVALLILLMAACTTDALDEEFHSIDVRTASPYVPTSMPSATTTATTTLVPSPSATTTLTLTPSRTSTETPAPTLTLTAAPTYVVLRAEVIIEQAVCHYGPGAPYLYKYGVIKGSNLEIIRRVIGHNYIEVRAIGGDNPCWVREDYMQIKGGGSLELIEPVHAFDVRLPMSPYYAPPGGITARRDGNEVVVSWQALVLRAGDDSEQTPYIVEAWVCRQGEMVFDPVRAWIPSAVVVDEAGCSEPSRARLIAAEKHGYTRPVEIEWPQAMVSQIGE